VFPALLDGDVPFYAHEIDAYWNDIGSVSEYLQGNFDALRGRVRLQRPPEVTEGVLAADASVLAGADVIAPVMVGDGAELGAGVELRGPVVIGAGARVGDGARLRDAVVLPGAEVPADAVCVGGLFGLDR
jgi:NDP-sugar pyrophosphorylase family protein